MAATSPLVRQWTLLRALSRRRDGLTVKEMAEELGVSQRTIRRDLETFQQVGFPIRQTTGEFGRKQWHLAASRDAPELSFAFDEAIALYLGQHLLEPLAGTVFWEASRRAFRKIRASLSTPALRYIDLFAPLFHQTARGTSDYSKKAEMIDRLVQATEERRQTFITYRSLRAQDGALGTSDVTLLEGDDHPFRETAERVHVVPLAELDRLLVLRIPGVLVDAQQGVQVRRRASSHDLVEVVLRHGVDRADLGLSSAAPIRTMVLAGSLAAITVGVIAVVIASLVQLLLHGRSGHPEETANPFVETLVLADQARFEFDLKVHAGSARTVVGLADLPA